MKPCGIAQKVRKPASIGEQNPLSQRHQEINMSSTSHANALYADDVLLRDKEKYFRIGVPLYEAAITCDWEAAKYVLDANLELVRFRITENMETTLHIAASVKGRKLQEKFVNNLVSLMTKDDLEVVDTNGNTAFYLAAAAGNTEVVKIMAKKNKYLQTIPGARGTMMPLHAAALFGHYKAVKYLYSISNKMRDDCWNDQNRGFLLEKCVENDMFDIAVQIVRMYPELGRSNTILKFLAEKPHVFSETKSSSVKRTFNSVSAFIGLKAGAPEKESEALQLLRIIWYDIRKLLNKDIDDILRGPPDSGRSGSKRFFQTLQLKNLIFKHLDKLDKEIHNTVEGPEQLLQLKNLVIKHVVNIHDETQRYINENNTPEEDQPRQMQKFIFDYIANIHDETKSITRNYQTRELKTLISEHINRMRDETNAQETFSSRVMFIAAEMVNTNFLTELIRQSPDLIWKVNDDDLTIFHIAVKHRQEDIYNLLYQIGPMKDMVTILRDLDENNMLHLAAKSTKKKNLEDVSGAALQMQQKLLWFKEVESMIPPSYRKRKNKDGQTPHELFTQEHQHLITKGEKWMKETASQCMVVAALIATIVFAAAFTIPGGYNQNDGIPMFKRKSTLVVFVVADAISLILSSASILTFLSILTSRYAERDFERSLPMKLMFGLAALFLSIGTMMVTFSVSFFVLYHKQMKWIPILISVFAITPAVLMGNLSQFISYRDVYDARFLNDNTVADMIVDNKWNWPDSWADMFPNIFNLSVPNIRHDKRDECKWKTNDGKEVKFSIKDVWEDLREKREKVAWWKMIWFSQCLTDKIWRKLLHKLKLKVQANHWNDIVKEIGNMKCNNSIGSVLRRISLGEVVYNIWKERNERIFTGEKKDTECLLKLIIDGIKLHLQGLGGKEW
ncbi:ankyrin repeat-containing domain, PGG domain protein [Artemisia annua]|uniref:Ankyrin repeat-containing domain, PGG domain protein n=1 Tax=Artemisia annua TaxID=35608 RepID=A0A2U1MIT5_ARTAN|nr:ankyrin repeat-containing domain, PGG domain protein [Artemisia annua]